MHPFPPIFSPERRRGFAGLLLVSICQAACALSAALIVQRVFDSLVGTPANGSPHNLYLAGAGLLAAYLILGWLRIRERVMAETLGQGYVGCVRLAMFDRLSTLAPRTLYGRSRGAVVLRFVGDLTALRQWVSLGIARLVVAGGSTLGALVALLLINWRLGVAVALLLIVGSLLALSLGRRLGSVVSEARRHRSRLATNVNEKITSMPVVQLFGQTRRERRRLDHQSQRLQGTMVERARLAAALRAVAETSGAVAMVLVLLLGVPEVIAGRATPGTLVAAITIIGILTPPLRDLARVYEYWKGAEVAKRKIAQFLELPTLVTEHPKAARLRRGPGELKFHRVSLPGVLRKLSAIAAPGSIVALVGPNGAGKSTLLSLAARLVDPSQGRVVVDGRNIANVTLASLRRAIGMVSPELPLLRGSVEYNLRYRWPGAPADELARIIRLCQVDEVLQELPDGLAARLQEGGLNLSPGQRQRIVLARALLGDPRILLLDEADAFMDPQSARILDRVLESFHGTVLMVTQRLDRVVRAEEVWYLDQGTILEQGRPLELLAGEGPTGRFFKAVSRPRPCTDASQGISQTSAARGR